VRIVSLEQSEQPDRIVIDGDEFEVESVADWSDPVWGGTFRKVVAIRREVQA